ncbi:MAG: AfsR/SARP family transcriptional regulator [Planctomycetota bacterium]|jgi:DNA-binding SARP family transcriptional activator
MLELRAFGEPQLLTADGTPLNGVTRQTKRFALLVFLACDRLHRPHRREEILTVFWPESDRSSGRNALRQSLHVIREELGRDLLRGNGSEDLWVEKSELKCDVDTFTQAIAEGSPELALKVCQADFLLGFDVQGCPEFGFWADERRTHLRGMAAKAARDLAHRAEGDQDPLDALHWWRRASNLRPFDETALRRVMSLLAWTENRGDAMAEFEAFRQRLATELEMEPSDTTLDLVEKISAGRMDEVTQWVGDRRGRSTETSEAHWRRLGDQSRR